MGPNVILAIGAIIVFGMFLRSSNSLMTGNTQIAEQNEYYITSLSLAQSIIDEAKTKAFDQKTVTSGVAVPTLLTPSANLGPEAGESVSTPDTLYSGAPFTSKVPGFRSSVRFNDVDDYAGYKRLVNSPRAEGFNATVSLSYASQTYPDSTSLSRTFCKLMTVRVVSAYMADTVKLSYAFTY